MCIGGREVQRQEFKTYYEKTLGERLKKGKRGISESNR
jgi:hypothetical protein